MNCFFKKVKPADAQIIKGYEDLRWDDQEKLRQKVDGKPTTTNDSSKNKKKYFVFFKKKQHNSS